MKDMGDSVTKKVFSLIANNEKLPFADGYFDLYLSSLSLMLVNDHVNQLSESYRVLQEGGTAGFTVWGRKENSTYLTFLPEILQQCGVEIPKQARTPFYLSDKDQFEKDVRAAGFKEVKIYYTQTNVTFKELDHYYQLMAQSPFYKAILDSLTEEQVKKVEEEFKKHFEERYGATSNSPLPWELLVCVAKK